MWHKIKNSKCDKTQKLKMKQNLQNLQNQNVTKNLNMATQNVTTQKLKMWQNKFTMWLKKSKWGKTLKLKMWHNSKTQKVTRVNIKKCDKTKKNQVASKLISWNADKTHKLEL